MLDRPILANNQVTADQKGAVCLIFVARVAVMQNLGVLRRKRVHFLNELVHKVKRQWSKVRVVALVKIRVVDVENFAGLSIKRLLSCRAKVELA